MWFNITAHVKEDTGLVLHLLCNSSAPVNCWNFYIYYSDNLFFYDKYFLYHKFIYIYKNNFYYFDYY